MTEQQYLTHYTQRFWKYWIVALIIGLIIGYLGSSRLRPSYEGTVSFRVDRTAEVDQSSVGFYTYDGYYAGQAALAIRDNFTAWLKSPHTVHSMYTTASLPTPSGATESLSQLIKVSDIQRVNTVDATVTQDTSDKAEQLIKGLVTYAGSAYPNGEIKLTATSPLVVEVLPPRMLIWAGTALAITLLGVFITLLLHYFTQDK